MPPEEENALTPEELERQEAEPLPDREVMTLLGQPPLGRIPDDFILPPDEPDNVA
jgi:hypothetical protein